MFIRLFLLLDLYAFIIGSYVIWTAVAGLRYSLDQIRKRRISVLLGQVWKWCSIVVKSSALLSIWVRMILVADIVNKNDLFDYGLVCIFFWVVNLCFIVSDICHPSANWASL